jgi:hypothetical protein
MYQQKKFNSIRYYISEVFRKIYERVQEKSGKASLALIKTEEDTIDKKECLSLWKGLLAENK